jgi:hypothetical protein
MKGNIMDKKILLGGAAALLLVGNMYATPANAAIDLSIGGEAKLTASMSDKCFNAGADDALYDILDPLDGAATTATATDQDGLINTLANTARGTSGVVYMTDDGGTDEGQLVTFTANPCGADNVSEDNPVLGFGKEITIDASGTLANGLEVSFSDKIDLTNVDKEEGSFDLTLGGAFGSLQFKDGAPSAVDAAMVTGKKDLDVTGTNLGFHPTETSGSAGMGILWTAPSMGNLDLYVSWAPNSGGDGLDTAKFDNTFAFGAVMNTSGVTIGAGYEAASANAGKGGECVALAANTYDVTNAEVQALDVVNQIYKGDYCGDETLMYIGATMDAADISFSAGYSVLDTDEADKTVMSIGASTTVSAYDVSIDYRQTTKDYAYGSIEDTQNVLALGLGTSLGDGVDLGLSFSTNDVSLAANTGGPGDSNNYRGEVSLTVGF